MNVALEVLSEIRQHQASCKIGKTVTTEFLLAYFFITILTGVDAGQLTSGPIPLGYNSDFLYHIGKPLIECSKLLDFCPSNMVVTSSVLKDTAEQQSSSGSELIFTEICRRSIDKSVYKVSKPNLSCADSSSGFESNATALTPLATEGKSRNTSLTRQDSVQSSMSQTSVAEKVTFMNRSMLDTVEFEGEDALEDDDSDNDYGMESELGNVGELAEKNETAKSRSRILSSTTDDSESSKRPMYDTIEIQQRNSKIHDSASLQQITSLVEEIESLSEEEEEPNETRNSIPRSAVPVVKVNSAMGRKCLPSTTCIIS